MLGCNLDHPAQVRGNGALALIIVSPSNDRSVGFKPKAVTATSCNLDHPTQAGGNSALTVIVVSPRHDRSIGFKREAVIATGCNLDHPTQAGGNSLDRQRIVSPRHDRVCPTEAQGCNSHRVAILIHPCSPAWAGTSIASARIAPLSPRHHGSVGFERKAVSLPTRDLNNAFPIIERSWTFFGLLTRHHE